MSTVHTAQEFGQLIEDLKRDCGFGHNYDVFKLAAAVGYNKGVFKPLSSREKSGDIGFDTLKRARLDGLIYLFALAHKKDPIVLKEGDDNQSLREVLKIIEGYANGGFQIINGWVVDNPSRPIVDLIEERTLAEALRQADKRTAPDDGDLDPI